MSVEINISEDLNFERLRYIDDFVKMGFDVNFAREYFSDFQEFYLHQTSLYWARRVLSVKFNEIVKKYSFVIKKVNIRRFSI